MPFMSTASTKSILAVVWRQCRQEWGYAGYTTGITGYSRYALSINDEQWVELNLQCVKRESEHYRYWMRGARSRTGGIGARIVSHYLALSDQRPIGARARMIQARILQKTDILTLLVELCLVTTKQIIVE